MLTHEQIVAESNAQVVANVMGRVVTRGELATAFNRVQPKECWKMPIHAYVELVADYTFEKAMISEAVVFFTGSKAKWKYLGWNRWEIRAAGYYATIGA